MFLKTCFRNSKLIQLNILDLSNRLLVILLWISHLSTLSSQNLNKILKWNKCKVKWIGKWPKHGEINSHSKSKDNHNIRQFNLYLLKWLEMINLINNKDQIKDLNTEEDICLLKTNIELQWTIKDNMLHTELQSTIKDKKLLTKLQ